MARQDAWARPLAKTLVDEYRVNSLQYIRVDEPTYDPSTGTTTSNETQYSGAGAVYPSFDDQADAGANNFIQILVEVYLGDVDDIIPTTRDRLEYLGKTWKVVNVALSSGDKLYSATLTARAN